MFCHKEKIGEKFENLDTNQDGVISKSEILAKKYDASIIPDWNWKEDNSINLLYMPI
jgi:hypothetical protein